MFEKEIAWIMKEKYNGKQSPDLAMDLQRLQQGEPVDFIIGFKEFLECKIDLSRKPLIPRPETEYWAEKAIKEILDLSKTSKIECLDIFAGSGCIGISVLKHVKNARMTFADVEDNCVEQIGINLEINGIDPSRYAVVKSSVFSNISGTFDFIFSNPPYCALDRIFAIQESVIKYESKSAVIGGNDGLYFIRLFLKSAQKYLKPKGHIYMEFDDWQKTKIEKILNDFGYGKWEFKKDQFDRWRWIDIQKEKARY